MSATAAVTRRPSTQVAVPPAVATPSLVDAAWLAANLDNVVIVDTRRLAEYSAGHIAGAVAFPLGSLLVEDSGAAALTRLGAAAQQALGARGIGPDDHVVLVDDGDGSAALGVFVCELAGVHTASALHGGLAAWFATEENLEIEPTTREPVEFESHVSLATVATFEQLAGAHLDGASVVDARSQLEHEGIIGTQCCAGRGHIPGSLHLEWTSMLSATGDLRPAERISAEANHLGIGEDDRVVVYCHSGHRAAFAALALREAGFRDVRLGLGSWHEWSGKGMPSSLDLE